MPARYAARAGSSFQKAEAGERCERVRHHLLEAELERERHGAFEPIARLLEVAGLQVVAAEVVARDGRVLLVARFERQRLLRVLDRELVVAPLAGDVTEVGEHRSQPGRDVELAEEGGALLEHLACGVVLLAHRRDRPEVAELAGDPELVADLPPQRQSGFLALLRQVEVAEAGRDGSTRRPGP